MVSLHEEEEEYPKKAAGDGGADSLSNSSKHETVSVGLSIDSCSSETISDDGKDCATSAAAKASSQSGVLMLASPNNYSAAAKLSANMARNPWLHFCAAWTVTLALSVAAIFCGNFELKVDSTGWTSRGTLLANRHTQTLLTVKNLGRFNQEYPDNLEDSEAVWDDLLNNVQPGWETSMGTAGRRRLRQSESSSMLSQSLSSLLLSPSEAWASSHQESSLGVKRNQTLDRHLQMDVDKLVPALSGCDYTWYLSGDMAREKTLWPIWKTQDESISALDPRVIRDICEAEEITQRVLVENDLCHAEHGCSNSTCLPPYSLVFFARLTVGDGNFSLSCSELSEEWESYRESVTEELVKCVQDARRDYNVANPNLPASCPFGFHPALLDESFGERIDEIGGVNTIVRYTSSIFAAANEPQKLFDLNDDFGRAEDGDNVVEAVYDTSREAFNRMFIEESLDSDMILAMGSAAVTALAILVHTRSVWLTGIGLCQIVLSFPLAYFVYSLCAGLTFFPFLNFIGVFVVFALGADDIFVAVDKWKNARLNHQGATTEQIAASALPDAAMSMFLTTITTAVAFFGTAICKVAPMKMFAVFLGLLVLFDYFLCCCLVFPAICLYDKWRYGGGNRCFSKAPQLMGARQDEEKPSCIRLVLTGFYNGLHFTRWGMLLVIAGAIVVSGFYAATLELPESSGIRLLSNKYEYEKNHEWRKGLLHEVLDKQAGSRGYVIWGITPADTGDHNNPEEWSQLVLDKSFDPSSEAAQKYLLEFCGDFTGEAFAAPPRGKELCPMQRFDVWLQNESNSSSTPSDVYVTKCKGATGIPVPSSSFHDCIIGWSHATNDRWVVQREGVVEIIVLPYQSAVRYDSNLREIGDDWKATEAWMEDQRENAPAGVANMYSSSDAFWWFDTNSAMLETAFGSAAIALAAAAIVMLVSSRSFEITFFAVATIMFVLLSVTAILAVNGWTLGFLESVCFAIAIGISCDFVIHFGHAYTVLPGDRSRQERSKFALIQMGPSILAAFFTTLSSSIVMLFTVVTFFHKFAQILLFTVLMATVGSFVVFITLSDIFGPSQPTTLVDSIVEKFNCFCCCPPGSGISKAAATECSSGASECGEEVDELKMEIKERFAARDRSTSNLTAETLSWLGSTRKLTSDSSTLAEI